MISLEHAKEIAKERVSVIEKKSNIELALLDEETMEFEYGWVFFYQSKEYVRTGDLNSLVGGNAPILIDKSDGSVHETGTSKEVEYYIEEYCAIKKRGNVG
jgi:hypothetical protein